MKNFSARNRTLNKRKIAIAFGKAMPLHSKKDEVKAKVFELSLWLGNHNAKLCIL